MPLQDVLGLGSEARMNVPSRCRGNWEWRFQPGATTPELAEQLAVLAETCDRDLQDSDRRQQSYREVGEDFSA
jgi:4-alpha-glucanotransferase